MSPGRRSDTIVTDDVDELDRIAEHARERIARLQGTDCSSELTRAVFYSELAAWPEWGEWLPEPPVHTAALERRWWA